MIARARLVAGPMAALVVAALLSGCASTGVTAGRLEGSVAPTFARLYRWQQRLEGRPRGARLGTRASCLRATNGSRGAGPDWTCTIRYLAAGPGTAVDFSYDVSVRPDGCWMAENGPPALGRAELRTAGGNSAPNPLYAVEGCFET